MSRKKILLVDDSSTILMMEKFILRNDPYLLITASCGEEAVQKAIDEKPDLILLDVVLPRMSGFEACRLIRDHEDLRDTPVILAGAPPDLDRDCGWTDCVAKPINASELLTKVRALLDGR